MNPLSDIDDNKAIPSKADSNSIPSKADNEAIPDRADNEPKPSESDEARSVVTEEEPLEVHPKLYYQESVSDDSRYSADGDYERTFTQRLYETISHENETAEETSAASPEPNVLYVADVFDIDDKKRKSANMQYQHSKPFEFDRVATEKMNEPIIRSDLFSNTLPASFRARWTGPIITVRHTALARVIQQAELRRRRKRVQMFESSFENLSFEKVTPSQLHIQSPFLYNKLRSIAVYYPSFFDTGPGNLIDLNLTHWSQTRDATKINEPWCFLLHRFPQIAAFIDDEGTNDMQAEAQHDSAGSIAYLEKVHIRQLHEFLMPYYESLVEGLRPPPAHVSPQVPFHMLWYFFAPGTDVYVSTGSSVQAMVVTRVRSSRELREEYPSSSFRPMNSLSAEPKIETWIIDLWYLGMAGSKIGRVMYSCQIPYYPETRPITSLRVCPASIWDKHDDGSRHQQIMNRSKLLLKALKQGHLLAHYSGLATEKTSKHYSGTIVIDPERGAAMSGLAQPLLGRVNDACASEYYEDYNIINLETPNKTSNGFAASETLEYEEDLLPSKPPESSEGRSRVEDWSTIAQPALTKATSYLPDDTAREQRVPKECVRQSLTDHQLLLLDSATCAFALKTKTWMTISMDFATEVVQSDESVQHLVLGRDELDTIKALSTRQYSKREAWAADFIEGKGTGQIVLLHGPPGVGKTYTVEAIAEYLCRPLLSLTVADIGTAETRVERELLKWFVLAESWDAVLLVDEADIFLERRQNRDLARNGLVSAFLRRMEYFRGLLFLTTNRVGQIDDAFISRVHVAFGYESLSPESRVKIWQGFLKKLAKERAGQIQIAPQARKWILEQAKSGKAQLNGRDIRNALQTAITLAEAEYNEDEEFDPEKTTVVVDQSHFARVLEITNNFQSYVRSIRREDERKRAATRMDRNDYFNEESGQGNLPSESRGSD